MHIRRVTIEHFRGIRSCDWHVSPGLVCLVGSGGSTKTTLLDAIGLALSRSYRPRFSDADFWQGDTSRPIRIEVAVAGLTAELIQEGAFGWERSGIHDDGRLEHDPVAGTVPCLLVRLDVAADLEPSWSVVRAGEDEGTPISAGQRAKLGFFRLGDDVDVHLAWGRTSALTGLTESRAEAASIVLDAHRQARQGSFDSAPGELQAAADTVKTHAQELGAARFAQLRPGLDAVSGASSSLVLHDERIPLTREGLGTRRLTSLAIQQQAVEGGSIIAVDEVEHGLEPHRLHHLLAHLRDASAQGQTQVLLTTHSPVVVTALSASELAVTRCDGGETTVRPVDVALDAVQGTVRRGPAAVLARRVVVAEGATEIGFVRGLCRDWESSGRAPDGLTVATVGLGIVDGGGSSAAGRAKVFQALGYPCAALLDHDVPGVDDAVRGATTAGVEVLRWSEGNALEDEIVLSIDDAGLQDFVALALERRGEDSVLAAVSSHLAGAPVAGTDPLAWIAEGRSAEAVRAAIAAAAVGRKPSDGTTDATERVSAKAWFKREDGGEELAELVCRHRQAFRDTHMAEQLAALREFIYVTA